MLVHNTTAPQNAIYYSQNNGKDWFMGTLPDNEITSLVNDPQGNNIYAYSTKGIYKFAGILDSAAHSLNWERLMSNNKITSVAVNASGIIAAHVLNTISEVYLSDTTGKNWRYLEYDKISPPIFLAVPSIAIDSQANVYINNGIALSTYSQKEKSWKSSNRTISHGIANTIVIDSHNYAYSSYFKNTEGGIIVSSDVGATWHNVVPFGAPLQKISIDKNNNLYLITPYSVTPAIKFPDMKFMGKLIATQVTEGADGNIYAIAKQDSTIYQWN